MNHRVTIPAEDLSWTAERSSGPGGQHVNKVATKVLLRFDLEATRALSR
ncbi:MAG: peptide chain release factor-like protein, partial [Myxococcota bacterium]